jgi:hypothetical protein
MEREKQYMYILSERKYEYSHICAEPRSSMFKEVIHLNTKPEASKYLKTMPKTSTGVQYQTRMGRADVHEKCLIWYNNYNTHIYFN